MKRIWYLFVLTVFAAAFNSCVGGWVASEPSYDVEIDRPVRPADGYIWIDGGWRWDYDRHNYVREHGYWVRPRLNRSWHEGYWRSGPRGKSWVKGQWRRNGHDRDEDHR